MTYGIEVTAHGRWNVELAYGEQSTEQWAANKSEEDRVSTTAHRRGASTETGRRKTPGAFKHLGAITDAKGGDTGDGRKRVTLAWNNFLEGGHRSDM